MEPHWRFGGLREALERLREALGGQRKRRKKDSRRKKKAARRESKNQNKSITKTKLYIQTPDQPLQRPHIMYICIFIYLYIIELNTNNTYNANNTNNTNIANNTNNNMGPQKAVDREFVYIDFFVLRLFWFLLFLLASFFFLPALRGARCPHLHRSCDLRRPSHLGAHRTDNLPRSSSICMWMGMAIAIW